jgi:hypothetical protein
MKARRMVITALCAMSLGAAAAPAAADPGTDLFQDRPLLDFGVPAAASNASATVTDGEIARCEYTDDQGNVSRYTDYDRTLWWWVRGTGRPVTVTTAGSNFDTVLALFLSDPTERTAECSDDSDNVPPTPSGETIEFPTEAGQTYNIQVGGCSFESSSVCGPGTGTVRIEARSAPPGNDDRSNAAPLTSNVQVRGENFAATEQPGEVLSCRTGGGDSPYGRTVWYRWSPPPPTDRPQAPAKGTAVFSVESPEFDSVLAVYAGAASTPARCHDDPTRASDSLIEMPVSSGEYVIQVGGYRGSSYAAQEPFTVRVDYRPSTDRDDDGVANTADCEPDNIFVSPHYDGLGKDCVGGVAKWPRLGADVKWDTVRYARALRISKLQAVKVRRGSTITIRCRGRGCPSRRPHRIRRTKRATIQLLDRRLRRAFLRRGASVQVRITKPGHVGDVETWQVRARRNGQLYKRVTERCVNPGKRKDILGARAG